MVLQINTDLHHDRSVTALAINPASTAPSLPPRGLTHARAHETAHWLITVATAVPANPPPLRHCAGQR